MSRVGWQVMGILCNPAYDSWGTTVSDHTSANKDLYFWVGQHIQIKRLLMRTAILEFRGLYSKLYKILRTWPFFNISNFLTGIEIENRRKEVQEKGWPGQTMLRWHFKQAFTQVPPDHPITLHFPVVYFPHISRSIARMSRAPFAADSGRQKWRKSPGSSSSNRPRELRRGARQRSGPSRPALRSNSVAMAETRNGITFCNARFWLRPFVFTGRHVQRLRHEREGHEWCRLAHARIIVIQFQFYSNLANYWLCARVSDNLCAAVQMQIHKISLMLQMRRAAMQHGRGWRARACTMWICPATGKRMTHASTSN